MAPRHGRPPDGGGYVHPTGADEVVISYAELGGFTTREFAFQQTPMVLVAGDGRVYTPGAQIAIYPGPLLPAIQVQTITEARIQELLAAADAAGLLADVDYTTDSLVADASTATVTISVNGETWVHEAYALGMDGGLGGADDPLPQRQALSEFIGLLTGFVADSAATDTSLFDPSEFAIEALPVEDLSVYGGDIEPTLVDWPADVSVRLAEATTCTVVPADEVGELFAAANQLTFFSDDSVEYQVLVRPVLPGSSC